MKIKASDFKILYDIIAFGYMTGTKDELLDVVITEDHESAAGLMCPMISFTISAEQPVPSYEENTIERITIQKTVEMPAAHSTLPIRIITNEAKIFKKG